MDSLQENFILLAAWQTKLIFLDAHHDFNEI